MKQRGWTGFVGVCILGSVLGVPSVGASPALVVVEKDKIHAEVNSARLGDVLKALADRAGLRIVWRGASGETVDLRWRGISLHDALRDLLRNRDFLLVYEPTSSGGMTDETTTTTGEKSTTTIEKRLRRMAAGWV